MDRAPRRERSDFVVFDTLRRIGDRRGCSNVFAWYNKITPQTAHHRWPPRPNGYWGSCASPSLMGETRWSHSFTGQTDSFIIASARASRRTASADAPRRQPRDCEHHIRAPLRWAAGWCRRWFCRGWQSTGARGRPWRRCAPARPRATEDTWSDGAAAAAAGMLARARERAGRCGERGARRRPHVGRVFEHLDDQVEAGVVDALRVLDHVCDDNGRSQR